MSATVKDRRRLMFIDMIHEVLRKSGKVQLKLLGDSMAPAIKSGHTITVESCDPEAVRIGDIVVFKMGKSLVVHRVTEIRHNHKELKFLTKSDNFGEAPRLISGHEIVGKVIKTSR